MKKLKTFQYRVDKAPERCTKAVQDRGQALSKNHRGAGREAIAFADELGKGLTEALANTEQGRKDVDNLRNEIRFTAGDEPWGSVATQLVAAGDAIVKYYADAQTVAKATCEDVAKGSQAERFKDKLKGLCTKSEVQLLDKPVDEYCKRSGKRSCDASTSCADVVNFVEVNRKCLAARTDLRDWCQDTNDRSDHDGQIADTATALAKCEKELERCK